MKNNAPRRKLVEDAIDLYTPSIGVPKEGPYKSDAYRY